MKVCMYVQNYSNIHIKMCIILHTYAHSHIYIHILIYAYKEIQNTNCPIHFTESNQVTNHQIFFLNGFFLRELQTLIYN